MSGFKDQLGDTLYAERYPNAPGHRGVDTSIVAAESMRPHFKAQQREVFDYLDRCGHRGATQPEISKATGIFRQSLSGRMRELVLAGEVFRIPEKRKLPGDFVGSRVYVTKQFRPSPRPEAAGQAAPSDHCSQNHPTRSGAAQAQLTNRPARSAS